MYFDSPFTFCERVGIFVLLDQTYEECRHDVRCAQCPWRGFFTGYAFPDAAPEPIAEPEPGAVEAEPREATTGDGGPPDDPLRRVA